MPSPQPPTASDTEPVPSSPQAQPVPDQSQTTDPHAGHDMNAMPQPVPPPEPDPHAQHEMPGMQPAQPASPMIHGAGPDMIPGAAPPPPPEAPPPPAALSGPTHAADTILQTKEPRGGEEGASTGKYRG